MSSRWTIIAGFALISLWILAVVAFSSAGVPLETSIAWLLLFGGVSQIVLAWRLRALGAQIGEFLFGIAYPLMGFLLLLHPLARLIGVAAALTSYVVTKGICEHCAGLHLRARRSESWTIADGVMNTLVASFILLRSSHMTSSMMGMLMGTSLLIGGISRIALGVHANKERLLRFIMVKCASVVCASL